jgi:hypothetical protein
MSVVMARVPGGCIVERAASGRATFGAGPAVDTAVVGRGFGQREILDAHACSQGEIDVPATTLSALVEHG